MEYELLFSIANAVAATGWLALVLHYVFPLRLGFLASFINEYWMPLLLSVAYAAILLLTTFGVLPSAEGGFDSLAGVRSVFEADALLLMGWIHYLAFDLFVGMVVARQAKPSGVPIWFMLPIWFFTFMFGPVGYLIWRTARPFLINEESGVQV
jgi:hypothetical protein